MLGPMKVRELNVDMSINKRGELRKSRFLDVASTWVNQFRIVEKLTLTLVGLTLEKDLAQVVELVKQVNCSFGVRSKGTGILEGVR